MLHIAADQFIDAPVHEVYDRVCARYFTYQPIWDPAIIEMVPENGDEIAVGTRARVSRTSRRKTELGQSEIITIVPGTSLLVENRYPKNREVRLIACHQLNGGGTRLHVEITSDVGAVANIIAPLTTNLLERALAISLREVKLAIENEIFPDTAT